MSFWRALAYFFVEAVSGLRRTWKSSLLAILTIAVSLFVLGTFLLMGSNIQRALGDWRSEARLIVYLEPGAAEARHAELRRSIETAPWVRSVRVVSAAEARARFQAAFPSLADLMEGWRESPLPPSLEVTLDPATSAAEVEPWIEELRSRPVVDLVDDDRDWLAELEAMADTLQAIGWLMSLVLLGAAAFTTGSVIRLAASMYQEEIAIMRMVGATEFLIRGPFYCEGLLQGALGSLAAAAALWMLHLGLVERAVVGGVVAELLLERYLSPLQLLVLLAVGTVAGLLGAVISLKGESLVPAED